MIQKLKMTVLIDNVAAAPLASEWGLSILINADDRNILLDILARTYAYRDSRSRAFVIYQDDLPVGMAVYYDIDEEHEYNFSQFFIDERYQGNGFGYEAASMILQMMKDDGKYDKVVLCYIDGDDAARKVYEKLGFHHTGEVYEDEIIMEMNLR